MPYGFGYGNRFRDGSCRFFGYGRLKGMGRGLRGMGLRPRGFYNDSYFPEMEKQDLQEYRNYLNSELEMIRLELQEVEKRLESLEDQKEREE